ncbi:unnamed protein product [Fraxinus pennsylvanica]|uniref:Uncharacterized protein n=1 Tax=Fraxinus pennsylvanica TaxID=56036 RepID=A0AAD1ZFY9_9LAMI|nr:unnamed protein product [Fraxinus pennsylvanica]
MTSQSTPVCVFSYYDVILLCSALVLINSRIMTMQVTTTLSTHLIAMAIGDDMAESSVSSSSLNSEEIEESESVFSPEDVAWADSCLSKDPLMFENSWNSLKDALLETLESEPDSSAKAKDNVTPEGAEIGAFPFTSIEDSGNTHDSDTATISTASSDKVPELNTGNTDDFWSKNDMKYVFLPTYNENLKDLGNSNPEVKFIFKESELEESTEDIFKVWDLDIPPLEDELIKQLNKALAESTLEPEPSIPDDSEQWKCSKDKSLDALISGIADLSLSSSQF